MEDKLFELVGLGVPFYMAAATYAVFSWLDGNASDEATQVISSWLHGRSRNKPVSWSRKIWPSERSTRLQRASAAFGEEPGGQSGRGSRLSGAQNHRRFGLIGGPSGGCRLIMAFSSRCPLRDPWRSSSLVGPTELIGALPSLWGAWRDKQLHAGSYEEIVARPSRWGETNESFKF
jgi:hypothetical protein